MGPSEKSFNQVKAILGKLDRNIDQLRERRTAKPQPISQPEPSRAVIQPMNQPVRPATSIYGRATPLPPTN